MAEMNPPSVIEADEDPAINDQDSTLGSDTSSSTQSISSSIIDYRRENGRTYHSYKDGKYNLPNDEQENERLDLQHHLCLLTFNNLLALAPVNRPDSKAKRVLDLGTGTGIWAIDYADEHPEAEVIGVDLSPIQPGFVPPNVRFIIDDIDEQWTYSESFDYIHSRMMNFSVKNWPEYLGKIYENLSPGGYVELQEMSIIARSDDNTLTEKHELSRGLDLLHDASVKAGRAFQDVENFKGFLQNAGFVDIVDTRFKWPTNAWPKDKKLKELGAWNKENMINALEAVTLAPFTRIHGWTSEEVSLFLVQVRKELNDRRIHGCWPIISIYARKPDSR